MTEKHADADKTGLTKKQWAKAFAHELERLSGVELDGQELKDAVVMHYSPNETPRQAAIADMKKWGLKPLKEAQL